jgi:Carboxypeptidase regulatory-like domain/TonB-dependent Receptor Plug Domain
MRKTTIILASLCLLALQGYAQNITGSMTGRVIDQQGAAVANAVVTVTDAAKNVTTTQKTSSEGGFSIAGLLPGSYSITVEAAGFKKLLRPGVALDANDKLSVGDLTLQVGAVSESIEVSATAALLQTESVERSATITGKQIENIEVNGRNALDMAKLVPGVAFSPGANYAVGNSATGANQFVVNGARPSQNQLTINGIGNVDTGNNGGMNVSVSLDSIAEFKILTGSYQAEYGRSVGAQISVVTKSGSSDFHGSGYWYHRNESLNANTFLNNVQGIQRPLFRYNYPGYTIGGPIYIPKLFERARNKAFFFWSQEWQNQLSPNSPKNFLVPTALERKGDFSQSIDNNRKPIPAIVDPITRQPYVGNVVPASKIYGPGQALLNLYPLPNQVQTQNFNYSSQVPGKIPRREDLLRIDYNLTNNLRVFGHYINDVQPTVQPYGSFVLGIQIPITQI